MDGGGRGGADAVPALPPLPDPVPVAGRARHSAATAPVAGSAGGGGAAAPPATADDDGPVSEVLRVHKAIRMELNLVLQRVDLLPCGEGSATTANPREVTALAERVSFLRRMVEEHSKAEDNVVLPKLEERVHGLVEKYSNEHVVERGLFEKLSALFVRLECLPSAVESERLVQSIREVTRALRDSMVSHLAEEEAQLWPLLVTHFTKDEAAEIVARIFGTMPAEHLQEMLPWMVRVLSASEQAEMMSHIFQVTRSTMFETWLKSWFPMPKDLVASPVSTGGVATEEPRCASIGSRSGGGGRGDGGGGGGGGGGGSGSGSGGAAPLGSAGGNSARGGRSANDASVTAVATQSSPTHHPPFSSSAGRAGASPGAPATSPRPTTAILNDTDTASAAAALVLLKGKVNMEAAIREIGRDASLPVEARGRMIHQLLLAPWVQTTAAAARSKDAARDAADRCYPGSVPGASGGASAGLAETSGAGDADSAAGAGSSLGDGSAGTRLVPSTGAWPVTRGLVRQNAASGVSGDGMDVPSAGKVVPGYVRAPTQRELEPVFRTLPDGQRVRGCTHYLRAAKLRAKCCDRIYPCRLCHDAECGHTMDRSATEEMLCTFCGTVQPVAGKCAVDTCGRLLARYYCSVCKYFDDDTSRSIYHCHSCNVCRVGRGLGIDFFHCMKCNACMNMKYAREHRCVERALESDCPVCHQFLFTSTSPVKYLRCGHLMHVSCYRQYARRSYSCPICAKSLADMSTYFERLDYLLAGEQMPVEYRSARADVWCNDCSKPSVVPYHFLYNRCGFCCSYNTRVNSVDPNGGRDRGSLPERLPAESASRLPAVPMRLLAHPPRGTIAASSSLVAGAATAASATVAAGRWRGALPPPPVASASARGGSHPHGPLAAAASPVASPSVSPALSATSMPPASVAQMAAVESPTAGAPALLAEARARAGRVATLSGRKRPRR